MPVRHRNMKLACRFGAFAEYLRKITGCQLNPTLLALLWLQKPPPPTWVICPALPTQHQTWSLCSAQPRRRHKPHEVQCSISTRLFINVVSFLACGLSSHSLWNEQGWCLANTWMPSALCDDLPSNTTKQVHWAIKASFDRGLPGTLYACNTRLFTRTRNWQCPRKPLGANSISYYMHVDPNDNLLQLDLTDDIWGVKGSIPSDVTQSRRGRGSTHSRRGIGYQETQDNTNCIKQL